ncbi:MAG: tRNA1(Val) (adenine(37)-N6)-methyltransferase [Lachnospiraceae bacterium]
MSEHPECLLLEDERLDDLYRNGYRIIQNKQWFCFGIDAVLLSDYAKVKKGETAIDLGTGTGVIPILLEAKTQGRHFTGLEIQKPCADMARRSVALNQLQEKVEIVTGDIKEIPGLFAPASFDVVTSNPPYMIATHGELCQNDAKAIARQEVCCTLEDVVKQAAFLLREKGRFYMIHKPFRLAEIFQVMTKYRLEPKSMRLVHPYVEKEPTMVLVEGVKGAKSRITVHPPLIVYDKQQQYTDEIYRIYGTNWEEVVKGR